MYMNMFMVFTWYKIQNSKIHKYCVLTLKKSFISILIDSETVFTKLNFRNMYFSILSFSHSSQEFLNFWINLLFSKYPTDIMPKYISQVTHSVKNLLIAKMNVKSFNVQWFISLHSVMTPIFGLVSSMKSASMVILVLMTSVYASPIQRRELEEMASKSKLQLVEENAFFYIILKLSISCQ